LDVDYSVQDLRKATVKLPRGARGQRACLPLGYQSKEASWTCSVTNGLRLGAIERRAVYKEQESPVRLGTESWGSKTRPLFPWFSLGCLFEID
jgi:hypothetical protein